MGELIRAASVRRGCAWTGVIKLPASEMATIDEARHFLTSVEDGMGVFIQVFAFYSVISFVTRDRRYRQAI